MARIYNSIAPNMIGDGQEKILETDDGKEYVIRNSIAPNMIGDGYELEIEEIGRSTGTATKEQLKETNIRCFLYFLGITAIWVGILLLPIIIMKLMV